MADIDTHRVIDLIASRESAEVTEWLKKYPNLKIVSRDGSVTYRSAIEQTGMEIEQVSDRFHLLKGLTDASKKYITQILGANFILPTKSSHYDGTPTGDYWDKPLKTDSLTKKHEEKVAKKEKKVKQVRELKSQGMSNREISKRLGLNRATVAKYLEKDYNPVSTSHHTTRSSKLKPYAKDIKSMLTEGKTFRQISDYIRQKGYDGSDSSIRAFAARERKLLQAATSANDVKGEKIERKWLISLLYRPIDDIKRIRQEQLDIIIDLYPMIGKVFDAVKNFKTVLFSKCESNLDKWLEETALLNIDALNSFINGVKRDITAVKNAIRLDFNNGLAEGSVNKLKVVKRIMYGRAGFRLLKNKLLLLESKHGIN